MYYLSIDTSHHLSLALFQDEKLLYFIEKKNPSSILEDFFFALEALFKNKMPLYDKLESIFINEGPGKYTSMRLGITVTRLWVQFKKVFYMKLNSFDILYASAVKFFKENKQNLTIEGNQPFYIIIMLNAVSKNRYIIHVYQKGTEKILLEKHQKLDLNRAYEIIDLYKDKLCLLIGEYPFLYRNELRRTMFKSFNSKIMIPDFPIVHEINAYKLGKLAYEYISTQKKTLSLDYEKLYPIYNEY